MKNINIKKFVKAKKLLFEFNNIEILDFDFSCIFTKDLKKKDKKDLDKRFESLEKALTCFLLLKTFHKEYGAEFRPDILKYTNG